MPGTSPVENVSHRLHRMFLIILVGAWYVSFAGCGGGGEYTLTGSVVYDGNPVYPGTVILRDEDRATLSGNLNSAGEFTIREVKKTNYTASIQTQKLANLSTVTPPPADAEKPKRREDIVPAKFKNANVDIPPKFTSFDTSGLQFDFSSGVPETPLEINLDR